jgi:glycosyltransferase involved in cell wall biosynthesis
VGVGNSGTVPECERIIWEALGFILLCGAGVEGAFLVSTSAPTVSQSLLQLPLWAPLPPPAAKGRILVVSHAAATFGESKGGADVMALRHATLLSKEFGEVGYVGILHSASPDGITYFAVPDTDFLSYDKLGHKGAPFGYLINHLIRALKAALVANRKYDRYRPNLVVAHTSLAILLLKTLHPRTPVVYQIHDGLFVHRTIKGRVEGVIRFLMNDVLERIAVELADHVLCVSSSIYEQLRNAGVGADKLSILPYVPPSAVPSVERATEHSHLDLTQSFSPYILSVGQQSGRKRFDLLIEAMKSADASLHLVLVGEGPLHGRYRDAVERLGLAGRVHLLRGITDTEIESFYSHACAFFLVSENEGLPVAFCEAMSFGCPSTLICPNIESAIEYSSDLAHVVKGLPQPQEIARLMNVAYQEALDRLAGLTTQSTQAVQGTCSNDTVRSVYAEVLRKILDPAKVPINSRATRSTT